jgi:hypothetical protein
MTPPSTRDLEPAEEAHLADVLRRLREHFSVWAREGYEHSLAGFAYYEGCAGRDQCCHDLLAEAAPFALGQELTARHGFRWAMLGSEDSWSYAVTHPALAQPIDLLSLEDASWNDEDYDGEWQYSGKTTIDSLITILTRAGLPLPPY